MHPSRITGIRSFGNRASTTEYRSFCILLSLVLCAVSASAGLFDERPVQLSVKGSFTTGARLLYNIDRSGDILDTKNISSSYGIGVDIRANLFWERFYLGLSAEKIKTVDATTSYYYTGFSYLRVPVEEGFSIIPIELTGYYVVPISSENIRFYLGGGIGYYTGERIYTYGGVKAATMNSPSGSGIHVVTGTDFKIFSFLIIRGEFRFRDPHFDSINRFESPETVVDGRRIRLPIDQQQTEVNVNGINYSIAIALEL